MGLHQPGPGKADDLVLVGASMGGFIIADYLATYPKAATGALFVEIYDPKFEFALGCVDADCHEQWIFLNARIQTGEGSEPDAGLVEGVVQSCL